MVANATMQQGAIATNPMTINPSLGYTENIKLSVETRFLNANKIMSPSQKRKDLSYKNSNSGKRVGFILQGGAQERFLLFSWILTFPKVSHSKEWAKAYQMVGMGAKATNPTTTNPSLGYTENMKLSVETCFLNANKIMSPPQKRQVLSYNISNSDKRVGFTLQGVIQEKSLLFSWILTFPKVSHLKEWVKAYRMVGKGATNSMTNYPSLDYTEKI